MPSVTRPKVDWPASALGVRVSPQGWPRPAGGTGHEKADFQAVMPQLRVANDTKRWGGRSAHAEGTRDGARVPPPATEALLQALCNSGQEVFEFARIVIKRE